MAKTEKGLFTEKSLGARPLAVRMRPRTLAEFVGQDEVLGPGTYLRRAIEADRLQSLILYGPPGTGKTTIAFIVSNVTGA
jgi:putative ATPase